jgi:3-phenylpropionate/trans-cinnamate dioxygenase ferredoxin component
MAESEADFVIVARLEHLPDGALAPVMVDGHGLVVARRGSEVLAFQATCPHEKADLAQGRIENGRLVCPRHLASFSLVDGEASRGWTLDCLKLYPVRVTDGTIAVDADAVRRNPPAGVRKVWDFTGRR